MFIGLRYVHRKRIRKKEILESYPAKLYRFILKKNYSTINVISEYREMGKNYPSPPPKIIHHPIKPNTTLSVCWHGFLFFFFLVT